MNPVNYARDPGAFRWRRDELNVVVAFSGFFVREDGRVGFADKATTLDAARSRACRLKSARSEEHTSELQSPCNLVCRLLLEKKKSNILSDSHTDSCAPSLLPTSPPLSYYPSDVLAWSLARSFHYTRSLCSIVTNHFTVLVLP